MLLDQPAKPGRHRPFLVCRVAIAGLIGAALGCSTRPPVRPSNEVITLAEGYMVLNEPHMARSLYEEALGRNPSDGRALLGLARVALRLGDYETALRHLTRAQSARQLTPAEEDSLAILFGRTYSRQGKPDRAWHYLWPVWRKGDVAVKSSLDDEIKSLARGLPADTPGVRDVIAFTPPPRPAPPPEREDAGPPPRLPPYKLAIIPRSSWGPMAPRRNRLVAMGQPFRITVHHSAHDAAAGIEARGECAALIRAIQHHHVVNRGWGDIGYHYIVDGAGRVWQGRSMAFQGAHAGDGEANRGNIGIVVEGNFNHQAPTRTQIQALKSLIHHLRAKYGIPAWQVHGHDHYRPTECPGRYLSRILPSIR